MTGHAIKFSRDLSLPSNAVTQKLAFLGISGSGKTYGAGKFAEGLLELGAQVVVIDTVGNWWGLRLGADGKRAGFPIPVLGGERGDVALEPEHGRLAAETVAETKASIILDVSDFTRGELRRFVTDFATALLALKKRAKGPTMVIWEECQDIVPQRVFGEDAKMVGAVERLIKKGRNYGVGTVLISQRAAAVNKDVLNQVETLFAFRTGGAQDRKAIEAWIVDHARDVGAMVNELPALPTGTCFCWSPQWLQVLKKVRVGKKSTFDASATPDFDDEVIAGKLAPVDLDKFRARMSDAIAKAAASDPEVLRRRVLELEKQLAAAAKGKPAPAPKTIEKAAIKEGDFKRLDTAIDRLNAIRDKLVAAHQVLTEELHSVRRAIDTAKAPLVTVRPPRAPLVIDRERFLGKATPRPVLPASFPDGTLPKGQTAMLAALRAMGGELGRTQLATLAGYSPRSSTVRNILSSLRVNELIADVGGKVRLTPKGEQLAGDAPAIGTAAERIDEWCSRIGGGPAKVLRLLVERYPDQLSKADIETSTGYSATSSTMRNLLSKLRSNGLLEGRADAVAAAPALFMEPG